MDPQEVKALFDVIEACDRHGVATYRPIRDTAVKALNDINDSLRPAQESVEPAIDEKTGKTPIQPKPAVARRG